VTGSPETIAVFAVMLLAMSAYALLGGADFGGGIWDLLAGGPRRGEKPREIIDQSVTPVWEANHVWLIFVLVLAWTEFPVAFDAGMTALFVPLSLSLLGIVLRGAGFAFRHQAEGLRARQVFGVAFAGSSLLAPFFLGVAVGAIAGGRVHAGSRSDALGVWTAVTPLLTGALFVAACAYVAAIYLIGDATRRSKPDMVRYFRIRATTAGIVTGGLAAVNLVTMSTTAPWVYHRLLGPALPLVALSAASGIAALAMIAANRVRGLRIVAALAVASVIGGWGWAQYPWLLPRSLSLRSGSAPNGTAFAELAVLALAVLLVAPSYATLLWLQQRDQLIETDTSGDVRHALTAAEATPAPRPGPTDAL
jgi:cytochrome d ubiquinol oxidase subunit II